MTQGYLGELERINDYCWRIPKNEAVGMKVEGRIFLNKTLLDQARTDQAPAQVANVACLPGIQMASMAMPDIHWGYGFPIGGVAATDPDEGGVISPGGVGYDINCGVRLVRSELDADEVRAQVDPLMDALYKKIPAGVGKSGPYKFVKKDMARLLNRGVKHLLQKGLATEADVECTEARGRLPWSDVEALSEKALKRGEDQCGTLGAGNHFLEVQVVDQIADPEAAEAMGLKKGMICFMIHSGSRGLGYQVCDDALRMLRGVPAKYGIELPDRQLACAPVESPEGEMYLGGMAAAANYAWANRQLLMWQLRKVVAGFFGKDWESLGLDLIYDVAHNIAKFEEHLVDGKEKTLCVHRKGATRAFPAGHPELPEKYKAVGQPVIIPGDMGRESWVLAGQPASMELSFGSTCHGAGRVMSRTAAIKASKGRRIEQELADRGVAARCRHWKGLAEEQPEAYKDVSQVVNVVHQAGLARKVARLRPIGVVKG